MEMNNPASLYIGLYEETYNIAHKDNYEDYLDICRAVNYKPLDKIKEYHETH